MPAKLNLASLALTAMFVAAPLAVGLPGCAAQRVDLAERFGYTKREQLVDSVEDAREEQVEAKEQFESALDVFLALTGGQATDLERAYRRLQRELDRSESQAEDVSDRINRIELVADKLFAEWEAELEQYASETLRRDSRRLLDETRPRYRDMLETMREAEASMQPVLTAFQDQVLYLKHNLNAQAISGLQASSVELQEQTRQLIADMQRSIDEADAFIEAMRSE